MTGNAAADRWALALYVDGAAASSICAIENVPRLCDEQLGGPVDLEVIDVHQQPELVLLDEIVAAPTLVRRFPGPPRRIVGDLSDAALVRRGFDLGPAGVTDARPNPDE